MNASTKTPAIPERQETAEERAQHDVLLRQMQELARELKQANLNNAVSLAMDAARGQGELVEHFAELGRRFGARTIKPKSAAKPKRANLRVVEGGVV